MPQRISVTTPAILGEWREQAAGRLGFDLAAQCRAAGFQGDGVCGISLSDRSIAKKTIRIRCASYLGRKTQANENGNRLSKHARFHRALLPNPDCLGAPLPRRPDKRNQAAFCASI